MRKNDDNFSHFLKQSVVSIHQNNTGATEKKTNTVNIWNVVEKYQNPV